MRIIKEEYFNETGKTVQPAIFGVFPDEWLSTPGRDDERGHKGGNGKDAEPMAPPQPSIDLAAVKEQASHIIDSAHEQADSIIDGARQEADRIMTQAASDADQIVAQATASADEAKKEAFSSGFSSGEDSGFKKGYEDGYTRGKAVGLDETTRGVGLLQKVAQELETFRAQILHDSKADIVRMALAVAEKVLHKEIMTDPMTVVSVVKNALAKVGFKRNFTIMVNPLDVEVLQSSAAEVSSMVETLEGMKFVPDPKVEPGGCIIHTESGIVDAQVDRQFNEMKTNVLNAMDGGEV